MRYALCLHFQCAHVGILKSPCITTYMHCYDMQYEHINCISILLIRCSTLSHPPSATLFNIVMIKWVAPKSLAHLCGRFIGTCCLSCNLQTTCHPCYYWTRPRLMKITSYLYLRVALIYHSARSQMALIIWAVWGEDWA